MSHDHQGEHHGQVGQGPPVLDIGDGVGALVLVTPPDMIGREIEVSRVDDDRARTHSQVHQRTIGGRDVGAAVYPALAEGTYRIWDDAQRRLRVEIRSGEVSELDWT